MNIPKDYLSKVLKSRIFKNSIWLLLLQGFNTIVPLITIPYITRVFGAAVFGEYILALNWIGYMQVIVEYGFGMTGSRNIAIDHSHENVSMQFSTIIYSRLVLLAIASIVLFILSVTTSMTHSFKISLFLLFLMVVAIVFQQNWLFQGLQQMKFITIINVICRTISVVLIFIFVKDQGDLYLYCILYSSTFVVASIIGVFVAKKEFNARFVKQSPRQVVVFLKDGWYLFLSKGMTQLFGGFGITVLGIIANGATVGAYGAIQKIPQVLSLCFSPIAQAMFPSSCQAFNKSDSIGFTGVKKMAIPTLAFFSIIVIFIILFRYQIVGIAFGLEYAKYSNIIIPLSCWILISILNNFLGIQCLVASGHQREYSKDFAFSIMGLVLLNVVLGYFFQAIGVAFAALCSEITLTCLLVRDVNKIKTEES